MTHFLLRTRCPKSGLNRSVWDFFFHDGYHVRLNNHGALNSCMPWSEDWQHYEFDRSQSSFMVLCEVRRRVKKLSVMVTEGTRRRNMSLLFIGHSTYPVRVWVGGRKFSSHDKIFKMGRSSCSLISAFQVVFGDTLCFAVHLWSDHSMEVNARCEQGKAEQNVIVFKWGAERFGDSNRIEGSGIFGIFLLYGSIFSILNVTVLRER